MKKSGIILSVCISSYNRAEKNKRLVENILEYQSKKISVVVSDDNSTDKTIEYLKSISDSRLYIFKNEINLGPRENWYETINRGNGKYILHLLDRDWLDNRYIESVINILQESNIGYGYIGRWPDGSDASNLRLEYYEAGEEALKKTAFNWIHPSGFFIRKDIWEKVKDREIFSNTRYGTYPHSYIYALAGQYTNGMLINYHMIQISNIELLVKNKSKFYENTKKDLAYWWLPQAWKKELYALTSFCQDKSLWNKRIVQDIIRIRFRDALYRATIQYQNVAMSIENSLHYNVKKEYISESRLIKISVSFFLDYLIFLQKKYKLLNSTLFFSITRELVINIKEILKWSK